MATNTTWQPTPHNMATNNKITRQPQQNSAAVLVLL
jgi:hypothetical protein